MSDIDVTVRLPQALVERARTFGVLTDTRIAQLLQAELDRLQAWQNLDESLAPTRNAFRADMGDTTEDDIMDFISDVVNEVRRERTAKS